MSHTNKKKKRTPIRRRKKSSTGKVFTTRLFSFLFLFGLLLFSMGAAGYVIFFRTSLAHGAPQPDNKVDIVFEEPYSSILELHVERAGCRFRSASGGDNY
jgi:hypothetical protein